MLSLRRTRNHRYRWRRFRNNTDTDDDNDGYSDQVENTEGTNPLDAFDTPADDDNDGIPNRTDNDANGDGFDDNELFVSEVVTPGVNGPEATCKLSI